MMRGVATEKIPFGALVLCRAFKVSLADARIANGIARSRPVWGRDDTFYKAGDHMLVEPIEGLGGRNLQAIADAPLMDANTLYLPAGKLSMAETKAREARIMSGESA